MAAERYILDTFALVALFDNETGGPIVAAILNDESNELHLSIINLGELFYTVLRERGVGAAQMERDTVMLQPNLSVDAATWPRVEAAASLKARGGISYADAFAAALAMEFDAQLVTGDQEFAKLESSGDLKVLWLPRRP